MTLKYDHRNLDPHLQSRLRLAAMALLAVTERLPFAVLRERLAASDGNLGAHMKKLRDAGYVDERKSFRDEKPLTEYRITAVGRRRLQAHLDHLQAMLGGDG